MKEVIEHLERMAETLDGVDEENWLDTPQDIAQIYRSVANEIRQKMSAQNQSVTNCNQLQPNKVENTENNHIRLNAAELREALEEILDETNRSVYCIDHIRCLAESALAAPPRNCDRFYSFEEAQKRFLRETGSLIVAEDILDWLFAEAKGE